MAEGVTRGGLDAVAEMRQLVEGDHLEAAGARLDLGDHGEAAVLEHGVVLEVGEQRLEDGLEGGAVADDDEVALGLAALGHQAAHGLAAAGEDVGPRLQLHVRPVGLVLLVDPGANGDVAGEEAGHARARLRAQELCEAWLDADLGARGARDGLGAEDGALHGRGRQPVHLEVAEAVGEVLGLALAGGAEVGVVRVGAVGSPAVVGVVVALAVADEVDGDGVVVGEKGLAEGVGDEADGVADGLGGEEGGGGEEVLERDGRGQRGRGGGRGGGEVGGEGELVEEDALKVEEVKREGVGVVVGGVVLLVDEDERGGHELEAELRQVLDGVRQRAETLQQLDAVGLCVGAMGEEAIQGGVKVVDGLVAAGILVKSVVKGHRARLHAMDVAAKKVGNTGPVKHLRGRRERDLDVQHGGLAIGRKQIFKHQIAIVGV